MLFRSRTPPQSPPVRLGHAMAYDQARNRTVLYGGTGLPGSLRNDTWEWDGTNWTQVLVSGPGVRHSHAMAFLSQLNRVVLFGGEDRFGVLLGDTWTYDGTAWTQLAIPGPAPRRGHGMVLRLGMDRLVLFGGRLDAQTLADDTWELIGPRAASANAWGTGCGNLAMAPQAPPVIGATATALVTGSPSMLSYVALGFNNSYTTFGGLPTSLSGFGMPGCWLYHAADLAVFGPTAAINAIAQQYALPLPPFAGLLGLRLYLQAWAPAPAANAAGLITSNVMSWDIGSF